jgi:hypothetical protein
MNLHAEASITLYAQAVIAKDSSGKVSVKQGADEGPIGTAVGLLTGMLVDCRSGRLALPLGRLLERMQARCTTLRTWA